LIYFIIILNIFKSILETYVFSLSYLSMSLPS